MLRVLAMRISFSKRSSSYSEMRFGMSFKSSFAAGMNSGGMS
jgi:hypothetical protein